ncbi:MAG: RNA polymerase sigma factor [Bacteroidales bacterium]|nr:RNA polymerase sigma factor [Bacteroidales bacterium]
MGSKDDILYYIDQILGGNINAYTSIVDRHKNKAYNLAYRICCNHEEAEEIAQDAFLKAYRSLASFKRQSSFSTWLYRIVYNTAVSHVRLKKTELLSLEDFPADATDFMGTGISEEEAEAEYRKSLINFAFLKISEEERSLITLHYYEDMSTAEISEVTGISKSNIKVKLFRARQKMLQIIENSEKKRIIRYEYSEGIQK